MRISAQRLYNTAQAGDFGLLAFMLECQDTQNYSQEKLVNCALACESVSARTHTLLVLQSHGFGIVALNRDIDNYAARVGLSTWKPMWLEAWDEPLEIRLADKQPLCNISWARAALISDKPHEYVMQLLRRTYDDGTDAPTIARGAATLVCWPGHWSEKADRHGTLQQVGDWLRFCHAQDVRAADFLWNYISERCNREIATLIFSLSSLAKMADVSDAERFLLKYASAFPTEFNAFVKGQSA